MVQLEETIQEIYAIISEIEEIFEEYVEWKDTLQLLLEKYNNIILTGSMDVGNTDIIQYEINTMDEVSVVSYGKRKFLEENKYINEEVKKMLEVGIIKLLKSHYSMLIVLVEKKFIPLNRFFRFFKQIKYIKLLHNHTRLLSVAAKLVLVP